MLSNRAWQCKNTYQLLSANDSWNYYYTTWRTVRGTTIQYTVQTYSTQCKHTVHSASIQYTVQAYSTQCKHTVHSASIQYTVQTYSTQCQTYSTQCQTYSTQCQKYNTQCKLELSPLWHSYRLSYLLAILPHIHTYSTVIVQP